MRSMGTSKDRRRKLERAATAAALADARAKYDAEVARLKLDLERRLEKLRAERAAEVRRRG